MIDLKPGEQKMLMRLDREGQTVEEVVRLLEESDKIPVPPWGVLVLLWSLMDKGLVETTPLGVGQNRAYSLTDRGIKQWTNETRQ